jgi:hypothetical protein
VALELEPHVHFNSSPAGIRLCVSGLVRGVRNVRGGASIPLAAGDVPCLAVDLDRIAKLDMETLASELELAVCDPQTDTFGAVRQSD